MMVQRLFIGYPLSLDLRMRLNRSQAWKNSRLDIGINQEEPIEVTHENIVYLGYFMQEECVALKKIEETANKISKALKNYCKEHSADIKDVRCFAQTFVH